MLPIRVRISILSLLIAAFSTSCALFQEKPIEQNVPVITVGSFEEIKEQPKLDSYGFVEDHLLIESSVQRSESLYIILNRHGVSPQVIYEIDRASSGIYPIRNLRARQNYRLYRNSNSLDITRMVLHDDKLNYVIIDWEDKVWVERERRETRKEIRETSGIITSSLYQALKDNNDNPLLGSRLSSIYGWQIDFFALQPSDSYKLIYEQEYIDGEPYGVGEVIAAEFIHQGTSYKAFHFETADRAGYFDEEGQGLQKALLKAPFEYDQRVSSGFSHNRLHPVLGRYMPHYGVDYAAPLGTPVISVGDGEVIEARYRGPNGNIVKIKHNGEYTTAYLHLNGFASGIRSGAKVKQGQVIGYVGRTGRVTGVHLDYRIYKNNQPLNPLTVELPSSESLTDSELANFQLYIQRYLFLLNEEESEFLAVVEN